MDLKLDDAAIKAAIDKTMTEAVESALGGYDVRSAVATVITEEVATGTIAEALREAVRVLDRDELVKTLAREIARAVTSATVRLTQEGIVHTVAKLRGLGEYSTEDKAARKALWAELFGTGVRSDTLAKDTPF